MGLTRRVAETAETAVAAVVAVAVGVVGVVVAHLFAFITTMIMTSVAVDHGHVSTLSHNIGHVVVVVRPRVTLGMKFEG